MSKVNVYLADGFEEVEGLTAVDLLRRAGIETDMVSIMGRKEITGARKIPVLADKLFEEQDDPDVIVLPGGMPGNMGNLMKQAQKMQRQMEEASKELEEKEVTAAAGGGAVEVTVSGKKEVTKVKIDPEAVDPDDVEMLEDLIMAATNEALRQIEEFSQASMSKITGGLGGMGGGLPF